MCGVGPSRLWWSVSCSCRDRLLARDRDRVSRKGPRRAKPAASDRPDAATASILPMEIQIGDRFTDAAGELGGGDPPGNATRR
jgi:hypothetical protein